MAAEKEVIAPMVVEIWNMEVYIPQHEQDREGVLWCQVNEKILP
jgi:hypothetical protein